MHVGKVRYARANSVGCAMGIEGLYVCMCVCVCVCVCMCVCIYFRDKYYMYIVLYCMLAKSDVRARIQSAERWGLKACVCVCVSVCV